MLDKKHSKPGAPQGRCVLEERLRALVAVTDVSTLDITVFYTVADVCSMLQCDEKTLKRRRDDDLPPFFISMAGLLRCPALFFWAWVADEARKQLVLP